MGLKLNIFTGNFDFTGTTAGPGGGITDLTGDVTATGPGSAPATVQSVGGKTASEIASSLSKVEKFTLSGTDITNKFVTLANAPTTATLTRLVVIGGIEQDYSIDFTVSGSQLSWNGLFLDGILSVGDKLVVSYN